MSIYLYDEAFVEKLRNWTRDTQIQIFSPDDTRRLFEVVADSTNDSPIKLPLICLRRQYNMNVLRQGRRPITFDGYTLSITELQAIKLNAIPIDISYQLDIYTRYQKEADEFLRNFTFNIINYPKVPVTFTYNGYELTHNSFIRMSEEVQNNSDVPERLVSGQFTRYTFNINIDDAYLWNNKIKENKSVSSELSTTNIEDKDLSQRS